jgi:hypothetical protein
LSVLAGIRLGVILGLVVCGATAGAAARTKVVAHDRLTAHEELRGSMTFVTPNGWREQAASGMFTRRFTAVESGACRASVVVQIRGKATRASAKAQVDAAVGAGSLAHGSRPGGYYGISPIDEDTNYGVAVVRVASRRFGQLRIFTTYSSCDESLIRDGMIRAAVKRVLRDSHSALRVAYR